MLGCLEANFLPSLGDFAVLMVSRDFLVVSSLSEDPEGVTRRVEGAGVATMVDVDGVSICPTGWLIELGYEGWN